MGCREEYGLFGGAVPLPHHGETDFPAIDVYEAPGELVIEAELPGVDLARVEVTVGEGTLLIEGAKDEEPVGERTTFLCMERAFGAFRRVVPLPAAADIVRTTATYRAGVLQVRVPRVDERRGMRRVVPVVAGRAEGGGKP